MRLMKNITLRANDRLLKGEAMVSPNSIKSVGIATPLQRHRALALALHGLEPQR